MGGRSRFVYPLLVSAVGYSVYWLLVIHTHADDFRTSNLQNPPAVNLRSIEKLIRVFYRSITWLDPILFPVAVLAVVASVTRLRQLWLDPLFGFAAAFYCGYVGFLVVHVDAGPHYFAVLIFPVLLIVLLFLDALQREMPVAGQALGALVLATVALNVGYIGYEMLRPQYTLRDACLDIRRQIEADSAATPLVIGRGAIQTSFYTHIPALDEIGSMSVAEKLKQDRPGWLVTWSDGLPLMAQPDVAAGYTFVPKGKYAVFDVPGRDYLLLYRIEPK